MPRVKGYFVAAAMCILLITAAPASAEGHPTQFLGAYQALEGHLEFAYTDGVLRFMHAGAEVCIVGHIVLRPIEQGAVRWLSATPTPDGVAYAEVRVVRQQETLAALRQALLTSLVEAGFAQSVTEHDRLVLTQDATRLQMRFEIALEGVGATLQPL